MTNKNTNPLLVSFDANPFGAIPFDKIKVEHFLPAIQTLVAEAKKKIDLVANDTQPATFENTVLAVESAGECLGLASGAYFNLLSAEAGPEIQALAKDISPLLAEYSNDISLNEKLFLRVKAAYDNRAAQKLSAEALRFLEKTYKDFARNGALLPADKKQRLREIDMELSRLAPLFAENVLKATNAFELWVTDKKDLAGLPDFAVESAAHLAKEKGKEGQWLFTLDAPSYIPFVTYADNAVLREKMARASATKALGGAFNNRENLKKIASLRHERALVLGFKNHADYVLGERMAKQVSTVQAFLTKISDAARPKARAEIEELRQLKKELGGAGDLQVWDSAYYSEKLKLKKYSFDEEELRPYFKLENVIEGVFEHARRLYNLSFTELSNVPVYHPDVRVFEVKDADSARHIGLFYADFFPRPTKKGGAWATGFREQGLFEGTVRRPHVSIVCNFTPSTPTKPSLISLDEVRTLFHEFGHALHQLLSECTYTSLSGTNVYWDFVELPSQIMENWVTEKESLDLFARHFESGEKIPEALTHKVKESATFQAAMAALRQVSFCTIDLAWHSADPRGIQDVEAFEDGVLKDLRLLPKLEPSCTSTAFSHIFAGGYSAGYYSYKWAEVLDADAFEFFKEKGLFNREVATRFRENILSRGGTEDPMELYKKFRGREPDPDALLRREGLLQN